MNQFLNQLFVPLVFFPVAGLLCTCAQAPHAATLAADYYVDAQAAPIGNGSRSLPWKTVQQALAAVPPNQRRTIAIAPGIYDLGGAIAVPSGVRLVGAGSTTTTIQGTLKVENGKDIAIENLKLEGKQQTYPVGLRIRDIDRLRIQNLVITGFLNQAINIDRVSNGEIAHSTITDSSFNRHRVGGGGKQSSAISLGNLTNVTFHHLSIDTRSRGGGGISSSSDAWDAEEPWKSPPSILRNVKFHNLEIKVDKFHAWGNGTTPQLTLELWHQNCQDCEIYNSKFNSTVSIVNPNARRVRVYNNRWENETHPYYACEIDSDNLEFDHNYIRGGIYPLGLFNQGRKNITIHHNIFENTAAPTLVGHFLHSIEGFKFYNNTVYVTSNTRLFYFEKGESSDQEIRNNIFYNATAKSGNLLNATIGVQDNLFFNMAKAGANALTFDPNLRKSGQRPAEFFLPLNPKAAQLGAVKPGQPPNAFGF